VALLDGFPAGRIAPALLSFYDRHARVLPWRARPGERPDPYAVWLSEIMLQQTTVATVGPYFRDFLARWPTVGDLAASDLDEVLRAWAGLGYYARARNLHHCARMVVARHGGRFPDDEQELRQLPGIGAYTAAAISAIAFDRRATAMDGNVERVIARLFAVADPLPGAKALLHALASALVPGQRPGDYTQALFDLGATICTPKKPRCMLCPLGGFCRAAADGVAEMLPVKAEKAVKPVRRGIAWFITDGAGRVLLRRRPETGLLGGMMEVPSTPWGEAAPDPACPPPLPLAGCRPLPGLVRHTFTHFTLELEIIAGRAVEGADGPPEDPAGGRWVAPDRLDGEALPTVMRKVVVHALARMAVGTG